ncbi:hypothetical protein SAMN05421690_10755 [Nitrosomonas sp. Nm51]|uniref:nuclear transport factor 2 family protein n=1 Tax=Nitrosomonas sp. Nm51 TaxID=133720 RepID=UPI0008AB46B8|nr:DUF4440 domain-containing protein [Nitrosomonas sp. Nm51]SER78127.1 hypothetical protein SAMN05421690_10755 [Nitrosomonas sp. Nm51]
MEPIPIAAQIKQLELRLLHTDMRVNPTVIDELLDSAFEEIDNNGQINTRQQVVSWLLSKNIAQQWSLQDFRIKRLSNNMVIAIYRAVKRDQATNTFCEENPGTIRSSIWQRHGEQWKMVFHQATRSI